MARLSIVTDNPRPASRPERSAKAEQTRQTIIDAAMRLFRTHGYDKATMRAIADEAGVSIGNAYYYFSSKEHLIQAYYDGINAEHAERAAATLTTATSFADRLAGVLLAWVDVAEPYHEFAGKFFKNAAEPSSPLSPFSDDSEATRLAAIDLHRQVVDGSDIKLAKALRAELPELMWLLQMGVVLFWVHDTSDGQRRTRQLVEQAVPVIDRALRLTRIPGVRGLVDDVVGLVRTIKPTAG
ncbi:TetR/AcrR family transcriptional regulator [Aeromicrobium endophyticum]|uniref:TetR/AcrR family transcriptional regulator n=1 Tax=Aeromicrobium endophyticum TaxID=2292704 RepID=A0A371PCR0_9ACTN|nr:TetR/AcrR family transcriptional regulator [Aeromicrobium endophyticum]